MNKLTSNQHHDLLKGSFEPAARAQSVPDYAYNPLNLSGELYTPVIDREWVKKNKPPTWPNNKKFAVCLTHDVDAVSETNFAQNVRSMLKLLRERSGRPIGESLRWLIIHNMLALKGMMGGQESFCQFDKWMEIEKEMGAKSTFFFAPERVLNPHTTDCMYRYSQNLEFKGSQISVRDLMKTMDDEGWEVGLHPSWNAHANIGEMIFQKEQIEQAIGHTISSVRQHFLKYDSANTHAVQAEAGFLYDSTLGYNDNVGFRRGTSYPFTCFQSPEDPSKHLLQIPLIAQDGALLLEEKGLRLNPEEALNYIKLLLDEVKNVGGVLTLSWHPHTMVMPGFWDLYRRTLELVSAEDPWFGTVSEVGAWWQDQVKINLSDFTSKLTGV